MTRNEAKDRVVEAARSALENFVLNGGFALLPVKSALHVLDSTPDSEGGWRPIETAPKDGTYILGNKRFLDAGWSPRVVRWENGAWLTDPTDRPQTPTLWQPLPAPPSQEQKP